MQCACGGQGTGSYNRYTTVKEASSAGYNVDKAPCVIVEKSCPVCKRHSQAIWYDADARPAKVNLLEMMRK